MRFCEKCNKQIYEYNKTNLCRSCYLAAYSSTKKFCTNCGKEIYKYGNKTGLCAECYKPIASEHTKELWKSDEYRNKVIAGVSKPRNPKFKEEQSERIKLWYENNPEQREIRSKYMSESWENGVIVPNTKTSRNRSNQELELYNALKSKLGDKLTRKTIKIDNKWYFPDMIYLDYIILEYYGDYWHANPDIYLPDDEINGQKVYDIHKHDIDRLATLSSKDYSTLVVWESDSKNFKTKDEWYNDIIVRLEQMEEFLSI